MVYPFFLDDFLDGPIYERKRKYLFKGPKGVP
jgi:hypothetical protein